MLMLLWGDLIESEKPVVLGAVLASLNISGVLGIIERKFTILKQGGILWNF